MPATEYTILDIGKAVGGEVIQRTPTGRIQYMHTDSRRLHHASKGIFIAIRGEYHNGHDFVQSAFDQGVRNFMVEEGYRLPELPANFVVVKNALGALQEFVFSHRSRFNLPVLGITGSNGKTIIKEWLYRVLKSDFNVHRSPKSYNSQIGVPLSLWTLHASHELSIVEAGISKPGEMQRLERMIQPTVGLFTMIGSAHQENFESLEQKLKEKLVLFRHCETLICCGDHELVQHAVRTELPDIQLFTWGKEASHSVQILEGSHTSRFTELQVFHNGKSFRVKVPFTDAASLENVGHVIAAALYFDLPTARIASRVTRLKPLEMRLEYKQGKHQTTLINDFYSADLKSLEIALDVLAYQKQYPRKTLILTDLVESGLDADSMQEQVAELIRPRAIQKVIAVGSALSTIGKRLPDREVYAFSSTRALIDALESLQLEHEIILIKGARKFRLERVSRILELQNHATRLEINLSALVRNLNHFRTQIDASTRVMVMVKALSYGTGVFEVASVLAFHQVDYLAVAYTDEGIALRKAGIELPIMVLSPHENDFDLMQHYSLEPELYSLSMVKQYMAYCDQHPEARVPVHLCFDTGMHRHGMEQDELPDLIALLKAHGPVRVASCYTHLVGTDDSSLDDFTHQQVAEFQAMMNALIPHFRAKPLLHCLNSGGIQRFSQYQMDMVRLGIGLHGVGVDEAPKKQLYPVASLKTTVTQVRAVKAGATIGYGRAGQVESDSVIATISIGYADGFSRLLSNGKGVVVINGKRVPTIGNVCMDMTMIDVTGIEVEVGDEVEVFGENLSIAEIAKALNTIPYEVLTSVSQRVKRIYYHET